MGYTHTTFGTLKTLLAARLGDTSKTLWTDVAGQSELGFYLTESLRVFQGLTAYFRGRRQSALTPNVNFYDLTSIFSADIGYTVRDRELIGLMQLHLYEPYSPGAWTGSEMFTLNDLTLALSRARNRFLDDTGILMTKQSPFLVPSGSGLVDLSAALASDAIIDVVRAQWIDLVGNRYYNVWKSDEIYADSYRAKWTLYPGIPYGFAIYGAPQLHLQLTPPNNDNGQLELITINSGTDLDPTANGGLGTLLSVPDNFSWALKWGALADLLSRDGQARDETRAEISKRLYAIGVGMALNTKVVLYPELDGVPVLPDTLHAFDSSKQGWQGQKSGNPTDLAILSHNLIAVKPAPDSNPHAISMDLVLNAQIPPTDADYVQVGREMLELLLDYGEFLALFKLGDSDSVERATQLLQRFLTTCAGYNSKVASAVKAAEATMVLQREESERPRRRMLQSGPGQGQAQGQ